MLQPIPVRLKVLQTHHYLPTHAGVLIQWGDTYLGLAIGGVSTCPMKAVSWVTLSLCGQMLPAAEKLMIHHGATRRQGRIVMVTFPKTNLRTSRASHPPQLHAMGDWSIS